MAFPEVATILDDFNRADATPLDGSWVNGWYGNNNPNLVSQTIRNPTATSWVGARYTGGGPYGPDICVFATNVSGAFGGFALYGRVGGTDAAPTGYGLFGVAGTNGAKFVRMTGDGGEVQVGSTFTLASSYLANDRIGFRIVGDTLSAFRYTGGAWSASLHDETDSNITGAGSLALAWYDTGPILDDFGGGTISSAPADLNVSVTPSGLYLVQSVKIVG